jgi:uncharacterized cupin superfamily protein
MFSEKESTVSTATTYLHARDAREILLHGALGAELLLARAGGDGSFSVVEHPLAPRALGSLVHTHRNEDEYSFVVEGSVGVEVGDETFVAKAGDVVEKPRGIPHAFWNATDEPARLLELIVPGGFERYFVELGAILGAAGPPDLAALGALAARYELEVEPESVPRLAAEHGLVLPG